MAEEKHKITETHVFRALSEALRGHHEEMLRIDTEIARLNQQRALVKVSALAELKRLKEFEVPKEALDFIAVC